MTDKETAKRRAWAQLHFGDRDLTDAELDCATYMPSENFSDGWDKGVEYALQWTSVKDALPGIGERVLICYRASDHNRISIGKRVPTADGWVWNRFEKENVTAWMPLPDLPETTKESENDIQI